MILNNLQRLKSELKRLENGKNDNESPKGIGTVRFKVLCNGNSEDVLLQAKLVLTEVIRKILQSKNWPSDDEWLSYLPGWFVDRCVKEPTKEEADKWLKWWRGLNEEEQIRAAKEKPWSVGTWIYWLYPSRRTWYWWDYEIINPDLCVIDIEVDDWPFPWGALEWLFRASGALSVVEEDDS